MRVGLSALLVVPSPKSQAIERPRSPPPALPVNCTGWPALTGVGKPADAVGDLSWPMPLPEEIRVTIDSPVADVKHTGERAAGMMTAAVFLQEFVGKDSGGTQLPWAHLDVAGPARAGSDDGETVKGGTGFGTRTLLRWLEAGAPGEAGQMGADR